MLEKLVLVTRKTRLQGLVERFNTRAQAKFYLEQAGLDFHDYVQEDETYRRAIDALHGGLDVGLRLQVLDRSLVSTYRFDERDVVVAAGQDGLVANTAKYVGAQPLLGVNPDPERFDGQLLPFGVREARGALERTLSGTASIREVTLAQANLSDGQRLLGFNDLFLGMHNHVSAQYRLRTSKHAWERQSSSGVIVSTGAGSTGWLSSVFQMASAMSRFAGRPALPPVQMTPSDARLFYVVREPFVSKHSSAKLTAGWLESGEALELESLMPSGGVVFSDGMESDAMQFTSGLTVKVSASAQRARLVVR